VLLHNSEESEDNLGRGSDQNLFGKLSHDKGEDGTCFLPFLSALTMLLRQSAKTLILMFDLVKNFDSFNLVNLLKKQSLIKSSQLKIFKGTFA